MKILVCIKEVLDPDGPAGIDETGSVIEAEAQAPYRMNHYDTFALEEALRLRESLPGSRIDALTVGPARVAATLRKALELGADEGIHVLLDDDGRRRFPLEIASMISVCAMGKGYDLVLAGVMSEDDMQGQVGPMLAEMLDLPCATAVMSLNLTAGQNRLTGPADASGRPAGGSERRTDTQITADAEPGIDGSRPCPGAVYAERELEGGRREAFELTLPAVLTVQSGINRPRYPALSHVLRAKTQALTVIPASTLPVAGPRERLVNLERPAPMKKGIVLAGSAGEKADRLVGILRDRALL